MDKPKMPPAKENAVKVDVTQATGWLVRYGVESLCWNAYRDRKSADDVAAQWRGTVEPLYTLAQLRDMVLAAVPGGPEHFYIGIDEVEKFRAETIANINAMFDKENGNG